MELLHTFEGIKFAEGQMPRAVVRARFAQTEVPDDLALLTVTITLPLMRCDEPIDSVARQALATSRALLNESVAAQWIQEQAQLAAQQALCDPPEAVERLNRME